jgi:hypothetical protein
MIAQRRAGKVCIPGDGSTPPARRLISMEGTMK